MRRLVYSEFIIFDRSQKVTKENREEMIKLYTKSPIRCPRCGLVIPALSHRESQRCRWCGLQMTKLGNILECEPF